MALERTYNIPLRKEWLKVPNYKRAKKAVKAVKEFLARHMKTDIENVKVGKWLNKEVLSHGRRKPPHHIKVKAIKDDSSVVKAELQELPKEAIEEMKREEEKKKAAEKKGKEEKKPKEEEKKEGEEEKKEEKSEEDKEKEKILKKTQKQAPMKVAQKQQKKIIQRKALQK